MSLPCEGSTSLLISFAEGRKGRGNGEAKDTLRDGVKEDRKSVRRRMQQGTGVEDGRKSAKSWIKVRISPPTSFVSIFQYYQVP